MARNKKEFREELTEQLLFLMENDNLKWMKEWSSMTALPVNGLSGKEYSGINRFKLILTMIQNNYSDPRFLTFNQVGRTRRQNSDEPCRIASGSKGVQVEYWFLQDQKKAYGQKGKYVTFQEAQKMISEGKRNPEDFILRAKYYTVFNGTQIEGLPNYEDNRQRNLEVKRDSLIDRISSSMDVEIVYDKQDSCYYKPSEDKIYLPEPEFFTTQYAFVSTALHELGHSTGAAHRLNRNLRNIFGTSEYAFEELVAEMSSCMISADIRQPGEDDKEFWDHHLKNHAGYVRSWGELLKDDPDTLPRALKLAEHAADYLEMHGGIITEEEYSRKHSPENARTLTVNRNNQVQQPEHNITENLEISFA